MGTRASKPVSLVRLFSVLKLMCSLYTKKDHGLLALAWPTRHKYYATTYVLPCPACPWGSSARLSVHATGNCSCRAVAAFPFRMVSVQSRYQKGPPWSLGPLGNRTVHVRDGERRLQQPCWRVLNTCMVLANP